MPKLLILREKLNLTQEELAERSNVSVRTIQRIEAGQKPKGHTLKALVNALDIDENFFLETDTTLENKNYSLIKLINFSSLFFTIIPPANIIVPLIIMFVKRQFSTLTKQIISLQILWTVISFIIFMLASFVKNWYSYGSKFILIVMIILILSNMFIIFRNAIEIDKRGKLFFKLNFNII